MAQTLTWQAQAAMKNDFFIHTLRQWLQMRQIRIYTHYLPPPTLHTTMIVCVCHRVSDRDIARCAHAGMGFDAIQFELGVATQCGCCESSARAVVAQCSSHQPVAALRSAAPVASAAAH